MLMKEHLSRYRLAADLLPAELRSCVLRCPEEVCLQTEEFRLRAGRELSLLGNGGEVVLPGAAVSCRDLQTVLDRSTEFSAYRWAESICRGFVTARGGCRVGLCGTAVLRGGEIATVQELSSVSIRIAKAVKGCAAALFPQLWHGGRMESTLIVAPPGGGKTTLLRDLIRLLSDGDAAHPPLRVAVADERGEIAAVCQGQPQFDVGQQTDVLTGAPKAAAMTMLLRAMNPQVIAVDEITSAEDIQTMCMAANCGVIFLATVHGGSVAELRQRPVCRSLLDAAIFRQFVVLEGQGEGRKVRVERC